MLLVFIGLYLLGTIAVGWYYSARVKTMGDFVNAGRNLPLFIAASAFFATWFGSETVLGASSEFIEGGFLSVVEDPFGAALCLFLVGLFFARPLYKLNILTFNDFFKLRFNRLTELISVIFMVPSYFGWIAAQLIALAIILNVLAGLPIYMGIILCTIVVVIYTYTGGMWAVSITDFIQTIIIVAGLIAIAIQLYGEIGGLERIYSEAPEGFFQFLPDPDFHSIIDYIAAWMVIGLGSIPQQVIFQRLASSKDVKTAVRASHLGGFMYLTIAMIPLFIGLCGKILYPEIQEGDPQLVLPTLVLTHSNLLVQILFFGALLSAILSTTSGAILAPASVIGENLIRPYMKEATDRKLLRVIRLAVIGVALISAGMAFSSTNIFEMVAQASTLSLVSLFAPLAAGLYWKRASSVGALLSMAAGMAVWLYFEAVGSEIPSLIWGLLASITGMIGGSLIWPDRSYQKFTS